MTTTTPSNKPALRLFAVTKRGDNKRWQEVGAAWIHKDGKGYQLKLDYLPVNGAELVLRQPDAAENASPEDAGSAPTNASEFEGGF